MFARCLRVLLLVRTERSYININPEGITFEPFGCNFEKDVQWEYNKNHHDIDSRHDYSTFLGAVSAAAWKFSC